MSKHNVVELKHREASPDLLTELLRTGTQKLIHQIVETELQALLEQYSDFHTDDGKAAVVRMATCRSVSYKQG